MGSPIRLTVEQFFAMPCPANGWEPMIADKLFAPIGNDAAGDYELVGTDGVVRARLTILPREPAADAKSDATEATPGATVADALSAAAQAVATKVVLPPPPAPTETQPEAKAEPDPKPDPAPTPPPAGPPATPAPATPAPPADPAPSPRVTVPLPPAD